jgi:superfamily II DNA or RNA helicase
MTEYDPTDLAGAVGALAARCDGAKQLDGVGFDGKDSPFGKRLAMIPAGQWTPEMCWDAWQMLGNYKTQLAEYGYPFDSIPRPPGVDIGIVDNGWGGAKASRDAAKKLASNRAVKIEVGTDHITMVGPYNADRVADCRAIPGRRWTGRHDTFPLTSAKAVVAMAAKHGIPIPDELELLARDAPDPMEAIKAARSARIVSNRLRIRTEYDPKLVTRLRMLPEAVWSKADSAWTVALDPVTLEFCDEFDITLSVEDRQTLADANRLIEEAIAMSKAHDADIELPDTIAEDALRPFQRAGVAYALAKRRTWIADEMGLGKTRQALAAVEAAGAWPALFVCPASVKENWIIEAREVLPKRFGRSIYGRKGERFDGMFDDFWVINYDLLPNHWPALKRVGLKAVVFDESHAHLSNPRLMRTKVAVEMGRQIALGDPDNNLVLLLTGSPISNFADGLLPQLDVMSRLDDFGGRKAITQRYIRNATTHGFDGHRMVELHNRMRATCYLRRVKSDVATELPPKERQPIFMKLDDDDYSRYRKAESDIIEYIRQRAREKAIENGEDPTVAAMIAAARAQAAEHLVAITALKQLAAKLRMAEATRWIESFLESTGRKLIVFGWHSSIVDDVADRFGGLRIAGSDPVPKRQATKERFQNDPDAKVISLQLKAGGVGITLHAASDVLFLEQGWTPATHNQAEDRAHRIGQVNNVVAHYLLAEGTIDVSIYRLVEAKRKLSKAIEDGEIPDDYDPDEAGPESILADLVADLAFRDETNSTNP